MNRNNARRLLGLAHACQAQGWRALVKADAELLLSGACDSGADARAAMLAREARGHLKDAVALLEEVEEVPSEQ